MNELFFLIIFLSLSLDFFASSLDLLSNIRFLISILFKIINQIKITISILFTTKTIMLFHGHQCIYHTDCFRNEIVDEGLSELIF